MIDFHVEEIDGRLYVTGDGIEAVPVDSIGGGFDVIADLECSPVPSGCSSRTSPATLTHATAGG